MAEKASMGPRLGRVEYLVCDDKLPGSQFVASMGPRLGRVEYTAALTGDSEVISFNGATLRTRGIQDERDEGHGTTSKLQWGHA